MKKLLLLIPIIFLLAGCGTNIQEESKWDKAVNSCIEKGGVPIFSDWTGYIKDCKFNKD